VAGVRGGWLVVVQSQDLNGKSILEQMGTSEVWTEGVKEQFYESSQLISMTLAAV